MIRVVVDTNVLVSAIHRGTMTRQAAELWLEGRVRLLISAEIVKEYARVLSYPKLHLSAEEVREVIEKVVLPFAEVVKPFVKLPPVSVDDEDLKFLTCAIAGKARYLVTGDKKLLRLERLGAVTILTPAALVRQFGL